MERVDSIISDLNKLNLNIQTHESKLKLNSNTDIYIVDSYGKNRSFYNYCKIVFLGGSLINHGGQNPLEAARFGCNILHGPYVSNFKEIYRFLKINNMSTKISNYNNLLNNLDKLFKKKNKTKKMKKRLHIIGQDILKKTYFEINQSIKNEI